MSSKVNVFRLVKNYENVKNKVGMASALTKAKLFVQLTNAFNIKKSNNRNMMNQLNGRIKRLKFLKNAGAHLWWRPNGKGANKLFISHANNIRLQ